MRTSQIFLRSGLTVAAVAALPLTLTAPSAAAFGSGISVSTSGSSVSVTTNSCPSNGSSFGNASLLANGQVNFSQGRQMPLSGTSATQSAVWSNVSAGTYTVVVVCQDGTTAGTQSVIVSTSAVPKVTKTPRISSTSLPSLPSSPSRGVMGGLGGATRDYGTATLVGGGALVTSGVVATAWYLRRRAKNRL
ncbi:MULTISPECIES: hypothetical protein [Streptomyces]|uniref:hypothetical protein n=1 Tax=Streptomyces TaxID=1883 RepID=UPI00116358D5|nr:MULTISPECIES: hypothetical protein [Streptomyces]MCX5347143.1 hypothetical protein [Streptomyces mirabilis]QDN85867.1 hypothetical protein FNV61_09905 [Streptomyces sp. RLB3-6]QDO06679.1 hypothetical protein FNV68_11015 [Streptomyces sp. S1D4-23]